MAQRDDREEFIARTLVKLRPTLAVSLTRVYEMLKEQGLTSGEIDINVSLVVTGPGEKKAEAQDA